MKKITKTIKKGFYYMVKNNFMSVLVAGMVMFVFMQMNPGNWDWFDITFFSAIILATALEVVVQLLGNATMNWLEDEVKLTTDYVALVRKYRMKVFSYDNKDASPENVAALSQQYKNRFEDSEKTLEQKKCFDFPIEYSCDLRQRGIVIEDSNTQYELPEEVQGRFDEIFGAHKTSVIFNQLNVRVDDWGLENDTFCMKTSRTTYFDSMVTNRAMDYKWSNGMSVRERYAFGPFFPELRESCLSNHLGFNGFVESSDGYIAFVKRGKNLSIGKGTYANSVGASLKAKYALNENKVFDAAGLKTAMEMEIKDELKIQPKDLESFSLENNVFAAYRDMVEGGKPQLLFYARAKLDKAAIEANFKKEFKKSSRKGLLLEDGTNFVWIKRDELKSLCVTPEMMIYKGKSYKMVPSAAACVAMLVNYLEG